MANLMLIYKLKAGVTREAYEAFTRNVDYPNMRGLKRVKSFVTHRVVTRLMQGQPSVDYVEVFEIEDFDGFAKEDMSSATVQKVMGEFMQYVDDPQFLFVEPVI